MEKTKAPKVFSLSKICPMCGRRTYLRMTEAEKVQWYGYVCYGGLIQDRFPNMDAQKREFMKSGYCPDCQEKLFGTEHDRSDFIMIDDITTDEIPTDVKEFLEKTEKLQAVDAFRSEEANVLTTAHKVALLNDFGLEDILYVDNEGNIKERQ